MKKIALLVSVIIILITIVLIIISHAGQDDNLVLGSVAQPGTFPQKQIDYPDDWPLILIFPDRFTIVKTNESNLQDNSDRGYVMWMRYDGTSHEAQNDLLEQLAVGDWEIEENRILDSNRYISIISQEWGSAITIVEPDPDTDGQSVIAITAIRNDQ